MSLAVRFEVRSLLDICSICVRSIVERCSIDARTMSASDVDGDDGDDDVDEPEMPIVMHDDGGDGDGDCVADVADENDERQ